MLTSRLMADGGDRVIRKRNGTANSCMCETHSAICTAGFCTALSAALSASTPAATATATAATGGVVIKGGILVLMADGYAIHWTSCAVSIPLVSGN